MGPDGRRRNKFHVSEISCHNPLMAVRKYFFLNEDWFESAIDFF
jgi:hypothetical protein